LLVGLLINYLLQLIINIALATTAHGVVRNYSRTTRLCVNKSYLFRLAKLKQRVSSNNGLDISVYPAAGDIANIVWKVHLPIRLGDGLALPVEET
jgi:hypothetical protein